MLLLKSNAIVDRKQNTLRGMPNHGWHHDFWHVRKIGMWVYGRTGTYHFYWAVPKGRNWTEQGYIIIFGGKK